MGPHDGSQELEHGMNATGLRGYQAFSWFKPDQRVSSWPLMGSPATVTIILGLYLVGCIFVGPWMMRDRKALSLRPLMIAYNAAMVAFSVFFAYLTIKLAYIESGYSFFCQPDDSKTNPRADIMLYYGWWYVMLKVSELLDTVFFVLRKKTEHVSFLHLLHHTLALSTVWINVNLAVFGHVALFPLLNCSVHIVMYGYYALAALPAHLRPNLWWKPYVTIFQIAQFFVLMVHGLIPVFHDCDFPPVYAFFMFLETGLFFVLFSDFYKKTYVRPKAGASQKVKNS